MALPTYDELVGTTDQKLPSYDELVGKKEEAKPTPVPSYNDLVNPETQSAWGKIIKYFDLGKEPQPVEERSVGAKALAGAGSFVNQMIPRSVTAAAGLLTPAVGGVEAILNTPQEATDLGPIHAAEQTPPYSQERFDVGASMVGQMLMAKGLAGQVNPKIIPRQTSTEVSPESQALVDQTNAGLAASEPVAPELQVEQPAINPPEQRVTSVKNSVVDQERVARGLPPLMDAARQSAPDVWDNVTAQADSALQRGDPHPADSIIEQFQEKPFALTDVQTDTLLHRKIGLQNEFHKTAQAIVESADKGDAAANAELQSQYSNLSDRLLELDDVTKRSGTETARGLAIRRQMANEDYSLAGMITQKRAVNGGRGLDPEEVKSVESKYNNLTARQISLDAYETSPRAEAYRVRLRKMAEQYARRTREGDFSPAQKKGLLLDQEHLKLQAELQRAREQWQQELIKDQLSKRGKLQRGADALIKWRQAFVISGVRSIAKLASAALEGIAILPAREAVGRVMGKLPGLKPIFERAPIEGGHAPYAATEAKAISETFSNLISDFGKNIRGQKPDFEQVYGPLQNRPRELNNYVGFLHGALKSPLARSVFTRAFENHLAYLSKRGVDITDPLVQMEAGRQAWENSQFWRFQNKNIATKAYRGLLGVLEAKGKGTTLGKVAAFGLKAELPVVTVPTNVVARTFEGLFGTGIGTVRLGRAYWKGMENLSPQQADIIARNFKSGSVGLGIFLIGYWNPTIFGGYWRPGDKDPDRPEFGAVRMGNYDVPSYLVHNPFLELSQMGATVRQVTDSLVGKGAGEGSLITGVWAGVTGSLEQQPFVRESAEAAKLLEAGRPEQRTKVAGSHVKSYVVPMAVQQLAQYLGPEHVYPQGFTEEIMSGIPGLRGKVSTERGNASASTDIRSSMRHDLGIQSTRRRRRY